ncbi:MAG TPA: hypothetical protein VHJ38_07905 [Nitrososphaeraceae archaeon]|nr:hypothetical protein [Nitrososphaeraceae archaeon]
MNKIFLFSIGMAAILYVGTMNFSIPNSMAFPQNSNQKIMMGQALMMPCMMMGPVMMGNQTIMGIMPCMMMGPMMGMGQMNQTGMMGMQQGILNK